MLVEKLGFRTILFDVERNCKGKFLTIKLILVEKL